jgi:hypothetical protein
MVGCSSDSITDRHRGCSPSSKPVSSAHNAIARSSDVCGNRPAPIGSFRFDRTNQMSSDLALSLERLILRIDIQHHGVGSKEQMRGFQHVRLVRDVRHRLVSWDRYRLQLTLEILRGILARHQIMEADCHANTVANSRRRPLCVLECKSVFVCAFANPRNGISIAHYRSLILNRYP